MTITTNMITGEELDRVYTYISRLPNNNMTVFASHDSVGWTFRTPNESVRVLVQTHDADILSEIEG